MRDQMRIGELAFFYHSNCKEPGIAGLMEVHKLYSYISQMVLISLTWHACSNLYSQDWDFGRENAQEYKLK
jgi:predicted RNA-binding protein with PUA-like domain